MTAVAVGGWLLVRLVDGRGYFTDPHCSGSLVGPGACVWLPEEKALHFVARGWAELVDEDDNSTPERRPRQRDRFLRLLRRRDH